MSFFNSTTTGPGNINNSSSLSRLPRLTVQGDSKTEFLVNAANGTNILTVDTVTPLVTTNSGLTVNGTLTYNNITVLTTTDPEIKLADGNLTNNFDIGFYGEYSLDGKTPLYLGLFRDHTDSRWKIYDSLATEPTTTVPGTYTAASMQMANLYSTRTFVGDGSVSNPAYSFTSDSSAGLYRIGTNNYGFSINGIKQIELATTGLIMNNNIAMGNNNISGGGTATFTSFVGALTGNATTSTTVTAATQSAITALPNLASYGVTGSACFVNGNLYLNNGGVILASGSINFGGVGSLNNASGIQLLTGATNGYTIQGNASGQMSWVNPTTISVTSLTGTANRCTVNGTTGTVQTGACTLSIPDSISVTTLPNITSIQGTSLGSGVWTYVSTLNQNLATTSSPSFVNVTASLTGSASLNVLKTGDTMTGQLKFADGSLAAPTWAFSGETNTGMYRSAATNVGMVIGGTLIATWVGGGLYMNSTSINNVADYSGVNSYNSGVMCVGNVSPSANVRLSVFGASTDLACLYLVNPISATGTSLYGALHNNTFRTQNNTYFAADIYSVSTFNSVNGMLAAYGAYFNHSISNSGTIANYYGVYSGGMSSGSATITNAYSGYFAAPSAGTNKTALYADNLSVGFTGNTPDTNYSRFKSHVIVGGNTTVTKDSSCDMALQVMSTTASACAQITSGNSSLANFITLWSGRTGDTAPTIIFSDPILRFGSATSPNTTGYSEKMRISSGGLSIGTTTAAAAGGIRTTGHIQLGSNANLAVNGTTAATTLGLTSSLPITAGGGGTASTPDYCFYNDNTTGMYLTGSFGTAAVNIACNSSQKAVFDVNGNLFMKIGGGYIQTNGTSSGGMVPHYYLANSGTNKMGYGLVNSANDFGIFGYRSSDSAYFGSLSCLRTTGSLAVVLHQACKLDVYTDNTNGNLTADTYTPTIANVSNITVAGSTANSHHYTRTGNQVVMAGSLTLQSTSTTNTSYSVTITLPFAMSGNFANAFEVVGGGETWTQSTATNRSAVVCSATVSAQTITVASSTFSSTFGSTATNDIVCQYRLTYTVK